MEGPVRIGELSVYNGTSATQLRRRVGMVFQKPNPFPTMSIYDNVAAGLKLNGFRNRKQLDEIVQKSLREFRVVGRSERFSCTRNLAPASPAASSSGCVSRARWPCNRKFC